MSDNKSAVLVCDDEESSRCSLSVVLKLAGFQVETANDGVEALALIARDPLHYKMVTVDNAMPRLDGIGLVRKLRSDGYAGKIMVVSGCMDGADYEEFNDLAVDGIFLKPFDVNDLRVTVSSLLAV